MKWLGPVPGQCSPLQPAELPGGRHSLLPLCCSSSPAGASPPAEPSQCLPHTRRGSFAARGPSSAAPRGAALSPRAELCSELPDNPAPSAGPTRLPPSFPSFLPALPPSFLPSRLSASPTLPAGTARPRGCSAAHALGRRLRRASPGDGQGRAGRGTAGGCCGTRGAHGAGRGRDRIAPGLGCAQARAHRRPHRGCGRRRVPGLAWC